MGRLGVAGLAASLALAGCTGPDEPVAAPTTSSTPTASPGPTPSAAPDEFAAGRSDPVADPLYPAYGNPALDVLHYGLDLTWAPATKQLTGTATITVRAAAPVTELVLDFARTLAVDGATVDGTAVRSARRGDDLAVPLPAPLPREARAVLVVRYHGVPRPVRTPFFAGWSGDGMGLHVRPNGEAWAMQQPVGAFTWYPVNDQPSDEALYDIAVTVPKGWSGLATGQLVGTEARRALTTFRWHTADPAASYVTTLAIGRYTRIAATGPGGVPVSLWLRTGADEALAPALRRVPGLLTWLAGRLGPYPFPASNVVLVDSAAALESQQMTMIGAHTSADITKLLLHELSHEWVGNAVTPRDWRGVWLSEGFATYLEGEWLIDQRGASRDGIVAGWRATDRQVRAAAGPPGRWNPNRFGQKNVYVSPALMLHEIRGAMGEAAFASFLRDWVQAQRNRPVDRGVFTAFVNRYADRDLTPLIRAWLDSPTTPGAG